MPEKLFAFVSPSRKKESSNQITKSENKIDNEELLVDNGTIITSNFDGYFDDIT